MEGVIKGAFGVSIFPTNIPYPIGSQGATNRVSQPSDRIEKRLGERHTRNKVIHHDASLPGPMTLECLS